LPSAWGWLALIAASLALFWTTRASQYHQLAQGSLLSSIALLILLLLVEPVWQVLEAIVGSEHPHPADRTERRE